MFKARSLFLEIGGIDLGFEQARFEIAWANEIDSSACKTYQHNFPNIMLIDDILNVNPSDLSDIDVLVVGFPCQPFSVVGYQRGFKVPMATCFLKQQDLLI